MPMDGADAAPKFELGLIALTTGAVLLPEADVRDALVRHRHCDWGDVPPEVARANAEALGKGGGRLVSIHYSAYGVQFVVVTESDGSITTVLLRSEV